MNSAGNDIVALRLINKQRTIRPAFYSKFTTLTELTLYQEQYFPLETFVWLLWSVKESAYKYLKRYNTDLLFSPLKLIVQVVETSAAYNGANLDNDQSINQFVKGEVFFQNQTLYFQSVINTDLIATVVNGDIFFKNVYWGIRQIGNGDSENQSYAVRMFTLEALKGEFPKGILSIEKSPVGYPVLLVDGIQVDIPISFSHHDRYVSYSFLNLK